MSARGLGSAPREGRGLLIALAVGVPCVLAGLAGGVALCKGGALAPKPISAPTAPAPEPRSVVITPATTAHLADDDRAQLRAMIREELAAVRARGEPRGDRKEPESEPDRAPPSLTNEQVKVFDQARAEVDQGIARGAWTEDDRAQLRATVAGLPPQLRVEIVRPLIVATNEGRVKFDGKGALF